MVTPTNALKARMPAEVVAVGHTKMRRAEVRQEKIRMLMGPV